MHPAIERVAKAKADYEQALKEVGKESLREPLLAYFVKHEEVKAVRWTQYTPYFNDGDVCEFGVNCDYPELDFGDGEFVDEYASRKRGRPQGLFDEAADLLCEVPEDVMKAVFGDHAQITATRDGFDVESYEHD